MAGARAGGDRPEAGGARGPPRAGPLRARGEDLQDFAAVYDDLSRRYTRRLASLSKENSDDDGMSNQELARYRKILGELLRLERKTALRLRNEGRINDEVLRKIEHELDLSETRLTLS